MAFVSLLILLLSAPLLAQEPPKLLTKHSPGTLRYISLDGRIAYVQKRSGVLGLVNNFRSIDFLADASSSDVIVTGSPDKIRLAIEVVPNAHLEYSLVKNHKIHVVNWGSSQAKEVGSGRGARLHLRDEWISFYDAQAKLLHVQNIPTQRKYEIRLSTKANPFFVPDVVMAAADNVTYTDINENGYAALISYNLATKASTVIYRSPQTGTKLELCRNEGYLAVGEFPYEGINRGSKILHIKLSAQTNLAGYATVYSSVAADVGNMVCAKDAVYFIKTGNQHKDFNVKSTDVVRLDLRSQAVEQKTQLGTITQLLEMDGRILSPFRGEFFVIEGKSDLGDDSLKSKPSKLEELPIDT